MAGAKKEQGGWNRLQGQAGSRGGTRMRDGTVTADCLGARVETENDDQRHEVNLGLHFSS